MDKRPNIIFYFSDQQRWDTVNENVTPTLVQMAEEGVDFTQAFTCQPVCGPARACLQTGEYATQNGCFINAIPLKDKQETIADILNANGYDTAYVGKWHLASGRFAHEPHYEKKAIPKERQGGYGYWRAADVLEFTSDGYGGYVFDNDGNKLEFDGIRADCITNYALDYINGHNDEKPFFLFLSHIEPHHQNSTGKFECPKGSGQKFKDYPLPSDLVGLKGDYNNNYADYLACCERLDYNLARVIQTLKNKGIYDNTVIIYTSDHGCHFKTRNFEYKRSCHDSSTHIPCVIRGGAFKGGIKYEYPISLIDYPPTILDIANIEIPKNYMGKSLLKALDGKKLHDCVFMQISESQCGRAIRTQDFKYAIRAFGLGYLGGALKKSARFYFEDYLYDLRTDKDEKVNLIKNKEYKEARKELKAMLIQEMLKAGEKKPRILRAVFSRNK